MTISHSSVSQHIWDYRHIDSDSISSPVDKKRFIYTNTYADGSGNNQMQDMVRYEATVGVGEGTEDTYDLAGGVLDAFGNTITFATIKKILLINNSTTSGEDIRLGGPIAGTTGNLITSIFGDVTGGVTVKAGGSVSIEAPLIGYAVTGGSADVLVVSNEGTGSITYQLLIGGTR